MERRMLIAGGGTGGHLFPAMAVAEEFLARHPSHRVLFAGAAAGIEARLLPEKGYDFAPVRSKGIAGKSALKKLAAVLSMPLSVLDAVKVVKRFRPHAALGVGGYASGPAMAAAWLLGVPCAIQEQNAAPGMANRSLARIAQKIFLSFEQSRQSFVTADRKGKIMVTGNPVRKDIAAGLINARKRSFDSDKISILVLGGSQGARGLNRMFLEAMEKLDQAHRRKLSLVHQTGEADLDQVKQDYLKLGLEAEVRSFIEDMAGAYAAADIAVSRSGAGAVAEIALAGLPAVFVPYPHAASDHQALNAKVMVDSGAALMLRQAADAPAGLAEALKKLMDDPGKREEMSRACRAQAKPGAAARVVDAMIAMMEGGADS